MTAIRVRQRLDSETLTLPQLRPFVGKEVEIVVSDVSSVDEDKTKPRKRSPLAGSILRDDDDPFGPAVPSPN